MSTTESVESVQSIESVEVVALDIVLASLKTFAIADLFKVSKVSLAEAEKRVKTGKMEPKGVVEKKATPKQLRKPTQWVKFTLDHALANGWESFTVENKKSHEIIEMPASVMNAAGEYTYPDGKKMILTHAMSLSKQRWAPKTKTGTHEELYSEFSTAFDAQPVEEAIENADTPVAKPKMVRKTAEEKAQEIADKKAKAEKAKADKKAATKAAEPAKAVKTPAKAVKTPAKPAAAAGVAPGKKKKVVATQKVEEWTCPADGNVYPWTFKGKNFLRNSDNEVWEADADGTCGDWAGMFISAEDRIDESVEDPCPEEDNE